ncbi:MAG: hypothetical protein JSS51_04030 [Planctomycetes bacterium]|nr:hypothetical protein [Planctomycetota bacterium]
MFHFFRSRRPRALGAVTVGALLMVAAWVNGQAALAAADDAPTAREMQEVYARLNRIEARQDQQLFAVAGAALVGGGISGHLSAKRRTGVQHT